MPNQEGAFSARAPTPKARSQGWRGGCERAFNDRLLHPDKFALGRSRLGR